MRNRTETKKINREQIKKLAILLLLCLVILLLLFSTISFSIQAAQSDDNVNISQLEQYLANSTYSDFQKRMVLNAAKEALNDGISAEDTISIIKSSVENEVDPYNVKKFIDTAILAKNDGIAEKYILNKVKEGLAKKVDERLIINAINQKSENMKIARNLLSDNEIQNGKLEEMIEVLAESLINGVSEEVLAKVLKISAEQDKSWLEVEEITQELDNLYLKATELGIESDKIEIIFNQALNSNYSIEDVCTNIQNLMVAVIETQEISSTIKKDSALGESASSSFPASPPSSSGSTFPGTDLSVTSGEAGSSPISSGGGNKTDSESGSSPLDR